MTVRNVRIHSGERTATSNGVTVKATGETIAIALDVTVISGTSATLDVTVEWSPDGTNFATDATPDAMTQITATGVYMKIFSVKAAYYRAVYTIGGDIEEIQAVEHNHSSGDFTLSFDGEGPTGDLDFDAPTVSVAAEGLLTIAVKPVAAVAAVGTLTIDTKPIDGDTLTIDSEVYTYQDTLTNVAGNVAIGATLATAQENIVAAVARADGYGTKYAAATDQHPTVTMADFASDDALLTARTPGAAGDAIATTETFDEGTNVFDATTLGAVTTGIDADTVTVDTTEYTFVDTSTGAAGEVVIGATLASAQAALVAAVASHTTVTMAAFAANDAVLTAVTPGTGGNALASTETFASASNFFDATTLGTETLGVNGVKTELELFTNITSVTVVRNGAGDWDVSFPSSMGDVATMTIDDTGLSGGSTATVSQTNAGVNATATFVGVSTHFDS